jgi:protein-tyrosine phosphatase
MKHVYWVVEGLLAGRPGPVEVPWNLDELRAAGFRAIVSLNSEPDPEAVAAAGLRHHSLPQPPDLPLTATARDRLLRGLELVLPTIHAEVGAGHPTLVHCHAGKDRTGLALVAYLVRYEGLGIDAALGALRGAKPTALSAAGFEATLRQLASS